MVEASILATALLVGRSKLPNILSFGSVHDGRLLAVFVSLLPLLPLGLASWVGRLGWVASWVGRSDLSRGWVELA